MTDHHAAMAPNVDRTEVSKGREYRIRGYVAPGFESVADAFAANFARGREVGAATAAYLGDRALVDLWGGYRTPDFAEEWESDTSVLLLSTTKGLSGLATAMVHSAGHLDYDAPVASYWPEFAQNGKGGITVRQLLGHQGAVSVFDAPITLDLLRDRDGLESFLARQAPAWEPGTRHGYHLVSLGWYQNALLRRADPAGRSIGTILRDDIASPRGVELSIGSGGEAADARRAQLRVRRAWSAMREWPPALTMALFNPRSLPMKMAATSPTQDQADLNTAPYLGVEIPSANGVASPRAVARTYAEFATGGRQLGVRSDTIAELEAAGAKPSSGAVDAFYCFDTAYSLGFSKRMPRLQFGSSDRAYGTPGAGGSQGFADPDLGLGFAYAPNQLDIGVYDDPRAVSIRTALYESLRKEGVR